MKLNAAIAPALCASALFAGTVLAQEEAEPSSSVAERPLFTVSQMYLEPIRDMGSQDSSPLA